MQANCAQSKAPRGLQLHLLLWLHELGCLFRGVVVLGLVKAGPGTSVYTLQLASDLFLSPPSLIIDGSCIIKSEDTYCSIQVNSVKV